MGRQGRYPVSEYTGSNILAVLRDTGRTQRWLARQMRMTEGGLSSALSGRYRFSQQFVERACAALEMPPDALFFVVPSDSTAVNANNASVLNSNGHTGDQPTAAGAGSGASADGQTGREEVQQESEGSPLQPNRTVDTSSRVLERHAQR